MSETREGIRSMADLLRSGATLTDLSCPACSSPLFRLKNGELWCAKCQKKVIVVKDNEQIEDTSRLVTLNNLESTLLTKIGEINQRIQNENDTEKLERLNTLMATMLDNLNRIRKIGKPRT